MIKINLKKKYFDPIFTGKKEYELTNLIIPEGEVVKIYEVDLNHHSSEDPSMWSVDYTGRSLIVKAGKSETLNFKNTNKGVVCESEHFLATPSKIYTKEKGKLIEESCPWYDEDCWNVLKAQTTNIFKIDKILEKNRITDIQHQKQEFPSLSKKYFK